MASILTVADIVADPSLDTQVLSGSQGLGRAVMWAHSCEIAEPHRWLGPHELLMTIGLCIPQGSHAQRAFIADLDRAGLAGITIGDDGLAPRLTKAMFSEADSRGFPILATGPSTPFAAIGRTVAAANAERQTMGVLLLSKLYQITGVRDEAAVRSAKPLRDLFGTSITVVDDATGCVLIGEGVLAPSGARAYTLRTHEPAHLVIEPDARLDGLSLVHLSQVLAVDANAIRQDAVAAIRRGSEVMARLLAGRPEAKPALVTAWGEDAPSFRVVAAQCDVELRVPLAVALAGVPPMTVEGDNGTLMAVRETDLPVVKSLLTRLRLRAGASAEHRDFADLAGAAAEASAELQVAEAREESWREYHGHRVALLARSQSEAEQIIASVLGPLASSDPKYVPLRETLFSFLEHDLRWTLTATALGLHRQGLVYRLNQVEELTSRSVRRTADVADFWLARAAWKQFRDAG